MKKTEPRAAKRRQSPYHHGDLRVALIGAARAVLETSAPHLLSMKALAESLGVSQPAPYRHFSGRDGLLAAVAEDGFERFAAALVAAAADGPAAGALERAGLAYVGFALSNIGVYRLMFSRAQLHAAPEGSRLARGADASFAFLVELVARHVGARRAVKAAVSVWATLHGVVTLKADGLLTPSNGPEVTPADVVADLVGKFGPPTA